MNKFIKSSISLPLNKEAPSEFRIWKSGNNISDYGDAYFTEKSAQILMEEQKKRGNLYSIDFNHMSLADSVLPEATKAAGWHQLEVRKDAEGNPELWAVNVDWTPLAKAGLEAPVPEWRYFSPAFYVNQETKEIISYTNTALCINPATHNNTMLASKKYSNNIISRKTTMDTEKEKLMTLQHLMSLVADASVPEETKKVLQPAIDQLVADLGGQAKVDEMLKAADAMEEPAAVDAVATAKKVEEKKAGDIKMAVTIAELTERLNKKEVKDLVLANANKIPAVLTEWALEQDIETITAYLAKAPLISTDKVTQVKTTAAIKGDKVASAPVNAEVNFIQNSFGIYSQAKSTEIISKDYINGTTNTRAINIPKPKQLKAARAASK